MKSIAAKTGWGIMVFLALAITLLVSRYLTLNPNVYFPEQRAVYIAHTVGILGHVIGSMLALALGPFQFLPRLRRGRRLRIHRWLGRLYLIGVAVGGVFGFYMAWLAYGGAVARIGFAILAALWLLTGAMAYRTIRAREIQAHRRWMMRNYALTFAAVTLRLWLPLLPVFGLDFITAYRTVAWLCWIPNLLIMEWWILWNLSPARVKLQRATAA
ncbi:MAG: DUF2306 domain-containing protein [Caldilineaceae bacterium]